MKKFKVKLRPKQVETDPDSPYFDQERYTEWLNSKPFGFPIKEDDGLEGF